VILRRLRMTRAEAPSCHPIGSNAHFGTTFNHAQLAGRRGNSVDDLRKVAHDLFEDEFGSLKVDRPEIYEAFRQEGSSR